MTDNQNVPDAAQKYPGALPPGKYFLIGPNGEREITDYYSLTNRERWLLGLPQLPSNQGENGVNPNHA